MHGHMGVFKDPQVPQNVNEDSIEPLAVLFGHHLPPPTIWPRPVVGDPQALISKLKTRNSKEITLTSEEQTQTPDPISVMRHVIHRTNTRAVP